MEPEEGDSLPKANSSIRNEKNTLIDYDEDRVRLEFLFKTDNTIYSMKFLVELFVKNF